MNGWEFYRHMTVKLANGRRLGHMQEVGHAVDYLHVRQGSVLVRDWYIPVSAIRTVTGQEVLLAVDEPELLRRGWHVPTEAYLSRQGATPGYDYTSPDDIPSYGETSPGDHGRESDGQ